MSARLRVADRQPLQRGPGRSLRLPPCSFDGGFQAIPKLGVEDRHTGAKEALILFDEKENVTASDHTGLLFEQMLSDLKQKVVNLFFVHTTETADL